MNGNLPSGEDFNFNVGGYPCAIGVNDLNYQSGGTMFEYRLVKMKSKASAPSNMISDWEAIHWMELSNKTNEDPKVLLQQFVVAANPKLKAIAGGEVPPIPDNFLDKCKWHCRYSLSFNPATSEVSVL